MGSLYGMYGKLMKVCYYQDMFLSFHAGYPRGTSNVISKDASYYRNREYELLKYAVISKNI